MNGQVLCKFEIGFQTHYSFIVKNKADVAFISQRDPFRFHYASPTHFSCVAASCHTSSTMNSLIFSQLPDFISQSSPIFFCSYEITSGSDLASHPGSFEFQKAGGWYQYAQEIHSTTQTAVKLSVNCNQYTCNSYQRMVKLKPLRS